MPVDETLFFGGKHATQRDLSTLQVLVRGEDRKRTEASMRVTKERGSVAAIAEIARIGEKISVTDMATIAEVAHAAGGTLVSVGASDDDDWCGNGRLIVKWPPPKAEFYELLDTLVSKRINFEVLINGIPVPEELVIDVQRHWHH
jgi:hypothetical protein